MRIYKVKQQLIEQKEDILEMIKYQTDQKIAQILSNQLPQIVKQREQCISNSLLIDSGNRSFIVYMARNKRQELILVVIDLSLSETKKPIRSIPVSARNFQMLEGMRFQISKSPFQTVCYSFLAYGPEGKSQNSAQKFLYFAPIDFEQIENLQSIELNPISTRQNGKIKDVKWYPYAPYTFIILTESNIITFKFDIDFKNPVNKIYVKDLKVSISNQNIKSGQFQQIAFAEKLNENDEYSSIGKKFSLYLIDKSGQIYLMFPFICPQIILDQNEANLLLRFRQQKRIGAGQSFISKLLKEGKLQSIQNNEQEEQNYGEQNREYSLQTLALNNEECQLFKLMPVSFAKKSNITDLRNICNSVGAFKVLTLKRHTIFLHRQRLVSQQEQLKVQILSEEPYQKLMNKRISMKSDSLILETVGEFKFGRQKPIQEDSTQSIRLIVDSSFTNEIFMLHNGMTCYRLSFEGLSNLLTSNINQQISGKLIDYEVLFKSNSKLISITKNSQSIFFIRFQTNTYLFQSVPLQSIQLRQIIKTTIQETQNLFRKIASQPEPNPQSNRLKQPTLKLQRLNEPNLDQIEKKLSEFNADSKRYIELKLQKIKTLSENVTYKQSLLENQKRDKQQLIDLINQAQENDKKIKDFITNKKPDLNKTEKDIERKINALHKTLDELRENFNKQNTEIERDENKSESMIQCKLQADAVMKRLEETRIKLIEKRDELKKQLA